jgi:hypothetical protein
MGPFPIIALGLSDTYLLQLPASSNLHPRFHVSQLKPYKSSDPNPSVVFPTNLAPPSYLVKAILDTRSSPSGSLEYLIKWFNFPSSDNSWEPLENLSCPQLLADYHAPLPSKRG